MTHIFSVRALSRMLRPSPTLANICPHPRPAYKFRSSQTHPAQKLREARVPAARDAAEDFTMHSKTPREEIIWPQISRVLELRNSVLGVLSKVL